MGKRSDFKRVERDFYPTPREAVVPLLPHLSNGDFDEPCAGDGALVDHLRSFGHKCRFASDIAPQRAGIVRMNAFDISQTGAMKYISNPPWPAIGQKGDPVISMALHLSEIAPTWFLLSSDFMQNKYFARLQARCVKVVAVGRVKWIPESAGLGKDNCCWYLFDKNFMGQTRFYGRTI